MNTARTIIIETAGTSFRVTLSTPLDLLEIWQKFNGPGKHPIVTMSTDGVARVSFLN